MGRQADGRTNTNVQPHYSTTIVWRGIKRTTPSGAAVVLILHSLLGMAIQIFRANTVPELLLLFGQTGLGNQCRPKSDAKHGLVTIKILKEDSLVDFYK